MKKLTLLFLFVAFAISGTYAQDAFAAYKKATKAFGAFKASDNIEKLAEAHGQLKAIEAGLDDLDPKKVLPKALLLIGDVNSRLASYPLPTIQSQYPDASMDAYKAYSKILGKEGFKSYVYKNAKTGLKAISQNLINYGAGLYEAKDYKGALAPFQAVLKIKDMLGDGEESILTNEDDYKNIAQYTGITALLANDNEAATSIFTSLHDQGVKDAFVFDGLYKATKDSDEEAALGWLAKGREAHPDDQSLLYSEINYFLANGKMVELEGRLKTAIEKDPDNKTLYSTLGNVYDKLYTEKVEEAGKIEDESAQKDALAQAEAFYADAEKYYKVALEKDPKYYDVYYGLGALYFNKAAKVINKRNKLPLNAQKEYDAFSQEATELFRGAYKQFVEAEKIKPSDMSLIIAFKELYANTNQLQHSKEYKTRLEALQKDGTTTFEPYSGHPGVESIKL